MISSTYSQTSLIRCSMGAMKFAGLWRLLDYQVTSVIQHCRILRIMSDYAVNYTQSQNAFKHEVNFRICKHYSFFSINQILLKLYSVVVFNVAMIPVRLQRSKTMSFQV